MDKQRSVPSASADATRRHEGKAHDAVTKYVRHLTFADTDSARRTRARVWGRAARQGR